MKRAPILPASAVLVLSVVAVGGGCNFGQSGIAPPTNRIFLPAGIVADPDEAFLYVVNSNSDLRFNAGTVVAVDLAKAALVRSCATAPYQAQCMVAQNPELQTQPPMCTKTRFSRTEPQPDNYCCVDMIDSNIINCNEPQFIQSNATIQIGSFGGAIQLQRYQRDPNVSTSEVVRRLFVAVRAEPSITYADVTVADAPVDDGGTNKVVSMRCTGRLQQDGSVQPINAFCDDDWKIRRRGGDTLGSFDLPEEPHVLALDSALGTLYIGHLTVVANSQVQGGGVSTLDVRNPQSSESSVRFAGLASKTFLPATYSQAVAALSLAPAALTDDPAASLAQICKDPRNPLPGTRVYATARYSTAISGMVLRTPLAACDDSLPEPDFLSLLPAESFYSSVFSPHGADIRGILFTPDPSDPPQQPPEQPRAYVLHRNDSDVSANPAALVVLDRQIQNDGTPANTPIDVLEVCSGPTAMQMFNAGRGKRIYITCYDDGEIYVVDPKALVVTARIDVGAGPTSLVFPRQDSSVAYVASFVNSHLSVIDLEPGSPTENHVVMRLGLPHGYGE
jgi:YVTN family beta-propeller protein